MSSERDVFARLDPPIPVEIVENPAGIPLGSGSAFGLIDYGAEHYVLFATAMDSTGEVWFVPNPFVRFQANPSMGRLT